MAQQPHVPIPLPPGLDDEVRPAMGRHAVGERLLEVAQHLWGAAEVLSGGLMTVPEFEAKLGMGLHLFQITDALLAVEHRLREIGASGTAGARRRKRYGLGNADDAPRVLWLAYNHFLDRATAAAEGLAAAPGALGDGPTRRLLRLHLPELSAARDWGQDAVRRYLDAVDPAAREAFGRWRSQAAAPRTQAGPRRAEHAARDARFTTFSDTRDYRRDTEDPGHEATEATVYQADLLELVRVNRDEIDAIETFALVYFDLLDEVPLEMLHDLARTAWDEVRHALLGQRLFEHMGLDPYAYPCSMIGIEVRARLGGWDALAQISLFGELNIISPMRELAARAHRLGDKVAGDAFDFICSDESLHLQRIRAWLRSNHPLGDLESIEAHTKRRAGQELERAGVLGEEYFVNLSSREIFELLGE